MLLYNGKVLCVDNSAYLYDPGMNSWAASGALFSWSQRFSATLLRDGKVLCIDNAGGTNCKIYNFANDQIIVTDNTNITHNKAIEIMLPNGEVLITGNFTLSGGSRTCEIYSLAGQWRNAGNLQIGRDSHVGILFRPPWEDKVLIAGGLTERVCELYSISADAWVFTDTLVCSREVAAMSLLPSGKALIIGGSNNESCELFDPATSNWALTDTMEYGRYHHASVVLQTGKVLTGGSQNGSGQMTCEIYDPSNGVWETEPANLITGRRYATLTALPIMHTENCSTNILISGGENIGGALNSCELYNYRANSVSLTGTLGIARSRHTATLLASADGEVLVTGGTNGSAINSSELFDIASQTWIPKGDMANARFDHSATLLANGGILVTGGEGVGYLNGCEIYNNGSWTSTGAMATVRARHSAVLLLDGRVMVIGGETSAGVPTAACEIWNGTSWSGAASLSSARSLHTATLLQSGKVLVVGGKGTASSPLNTCETYDPAANNWATEGNLTTARYAHNTILLYSGLVLVTGGTDGSNYFNSCEIWDPAAELDIGTGRHRWKVTASMGNGRGYQGSVLIPSIKPYVYMMTGYNGSYPTAIQKYDVGLDYREEWQSVITNRPSIGFIFPTMNITGELFRDATEADGGNYCHISSNDHPIISLVRVGSGNWQSNGGGEIMHTPHSTSWSETHTNVTPTISNIQGYYKLWSIVNGIPCKWYKECVDVEENGKQGYFMPSVFPNPSMGSVMFKLGNVKVNTNITIYDCAGRIVRSITTIPGTNEVKLSGLKTGIYFYRIENNISTEKGKFVVL
ncbi:MAG: T9SS type A sorting domain-containing protein [Candidatus Stahlbacteria bacterium]|nr:T9SS type A sorting domain-containing protein [Candidatus Stahlbacteria bacterium]